MIKKQKKGYKKAIKENKIDINLKNRDYDLLKLKSSYQSVLMISILISILIIIMICYVINYLLKLKKCYCFDNENNDTKVNIEFLLIMHIIFLAINLIILINLISYYFSIDKIKVSGGSIINKNKIIGMIIILLYTLVYGFFIYNIYKLSNNIKKDCECSRNPIRFLLYIEAFLLLIHLVITLYLGIFFINK